MISLQPYPVRVPDTCRRVTWRGLWRRREFPCVVWHQIRAELLGPFGVSGVPRLRAGSSKAAR